MVDSDVGDDRASWICGIAIYSLLAFSVLVLSIRNLISQCNQQRARPGAEPSTSLLPAASQRQKRTQLNYIQRLFSFVMFLFALGRVAWCTLRMDQGDSLTSFSLNRLCLVSFFSAFCLIVFYLAESLHKRYFGESLTFLPTLGWAFIAVNSILWIISVALIVVYVVQQGPDGLVQEGNLVYELTIGIVVVVDFLLAVGISIYGFRLLHLRTRNRLLQTEAPPSTQGTRHAIMSTVSTVIISASFFARVVMFVWRPITGQKLDPVLFRVVGYYAAEALPAALQLLLLYSIKEKQVQRTEYIGDLYDGFSDPTPNSSLPVGSYGS